MTLPTSTNTRKTALNRTISATALALALATPVAAQAQDSANTATSNGQIAESRYFLQLLTQTFDGLEERSHTQNASFGRMRKGDESWILIDYGDGAMALERPGVLEVGSFTSQTPTEIALAYDYRTHELRGNAATSAYHNQFIRPLLNTSPALGQDANWQTQLSAQQLGIDGAHGDAFTVELSRKYFSWNGKPLVLIEYNLPAFTYQAGDGQTVVHWARGAALADPGFGEIYWSASLHRAAGNGAGQDTRPYRFARNLIAVDQAGTPLLDPGAIPDLAPVMAQFYSDNATALLPTVESLALPDQTPLQLAARIDIAASTILENSANQLGELLGSHLAGENGSNAGAAIESGLQYVEWPDKTLDTLKTIDLTAEGLRQAGITYADFERLDDGVKAARNETNRLKAEISTVRNYYQSISREARQLEAQLEAGMRGANSYSEFANSPATGRILERMAELESSARTTLYRAAQIENDIAINTRARNAIYARMGDIEEIATALQRSGLGRFATTMTGLLDNTPVKGVIGAFDIAGYYGQASQVGDINALEARYSTSGGVVSGLVFDMLGIGTAAFSGNVPATIADAVMVGSTRVTDIYFAHQAWEQSGLDQKTAHLQYMHTLMRYNDQLHEKFKEEMESGLKEVSDGIEELDGMLGEGRMGSNGPIDTSDPRFDPVTGLPKSLAYWEWLKINDRAKLIERGINPDAPAGHTGPWPPVVPTPQTTRRPTVDDGGPGYPTAQPRDPATNTANQAPTTAPAPALTAQEIAAIEREERRAQSQADLDAYQAELLANRSQEEDSATRRETASYLTDQGTSELKITPLDWKPVEFKPVEWKPVEFTPVEFEPVTWTPPEWVPPTFQIESPSQINWTDFDDGEQWGGGVQNLAWDYSGMSGTVATDLSKWEEWLAGQDMRQLERLALQAGYPNLASALADAANLLKQADDTGWRQWAMAAPSCNGPAGCGPQYLERWAAKRSRLALGDILAMDREFFSTAGLTDVEIAGLVLAFSIFDFGLEDGDIVNVTVKQFGQTLLNQTLSTTNAGTSFQVGVQAGVVAVKMTALNTGEIPPNTAALTILDVSGGDEDQQYSLDEGESADLRVTVGE